MKRYYYIAVYTDNELKLVTDIDYETKTCRWSKDGVPLKLTKARAEEIAFGLFVNFFAVFVVESFSDISTQVFLKD